MDFTMDLLARIPIFVQSQSRSPELYHFSLKRQQQQQCQFNSMNESGEIYIVSLLYSCCTKKSGSSDIVIYEET